MILTVDIGNTNIMLGGFESDKPAFVARVSTDPLKTEDEYASILLNTLALHGVDKAEIKGAIISSVVPPLNAVIKRAIAFLHGVEPLMVGPGIKTGINIHCDTPSSVGADLICDCVAAHHIYGSPALIIDMGTATKMMVVNRKGVFTGASIIPGVLMGLNALAEGTAQLPKVSLEAPNAIVAKNTADCMKSGVIFGNAAMVDGMIDRINEEVGETLPVYATGGLASVIVRYCKHDITLDEHLVLKGLKILFDKNNLITLLCITPSGDNINFIGVVPRKRTTARRIYDSNKQKENVDAEACAFGTAYRARGIACLSWQLCEDRQSGIHIAYADTGRARCGIVRPHGRCVAWRCRGHGVFRDGRRGVLV